MEKDYGLVSIITPNFNCVRYISKTIESVLSQTYTNWEMLIQDDCSNDGSYEVALEYAKKDSRIKVERNSENCRSAVTRNNAIKRAKGVWVAFLDSDDLWVPEKLETQLKWMIDNNADFSFTEYEHIDENDEPMMLKAKAKRHITYRQMLFHCWTGCLTVMFKQDGEKVYGPDVRSNNDYALFLKVLKTKKNAMGMPQCTAFYRIRRKSVSRNKWKKIKPMIEVLNKHEGISVPLAYFCIFTNIFIKTIYKYKKIKESDVKKLNLR